ncbi:hypothetical protein OIU78_029641 [Salix suchowensis]|nr:hypothetical protein OIU78_029641 [Salix suchowensis]
MFRVTSLEMEREDGLLLWARSQVMKAFTRSHEDSFGHSQNGVFVCVVVAVVKVADVVIKVAKVVVKVAKVAKVVVVFF